MKYRVEIRQTVDYFHTVVIDAEDEDAAGEAALDEVEENLAVEVPEEGEQHNSFTLQDITPIESPQESAG